MAISSYGVYLMKGAGTKGSLTWTKLVNIKDFPDLQGDPNMLPTTTLSDGEETNINGIKKSEPKPFTCNYDLDTYTTLTTSEGVEGYYAVWFGHTSTGEPDGHEGKYEGKGMPSVKISGKGVDEVLEMVITFAMSEGFKLTA